VSESALRAECATDGTCRYTFTRSIPADARGTFAVGIEARRTEVLYGGTTKQRSIQYGAKNEVFYFSVDGSRVTPRRQVVSTALCNQCHADLALHGQNRHETELCVICHNPSETDARRRALPNVPAAIRNQPPHGVNLALMIHRIHSGERLKADGREATIVGFGGNVYDFTEVRYPAFSLNGQPGERRTCSNCHVGGSEQMLTRATLDVTDPQGPINPVKPITSACTGCHVKLSTASHALVNTSILGESCDTCHSSTSAFAVSKVHAQ
jgi:OmcA/MtrC family decaheme c-type cytochrome